MLHHLTKPFISPKFPRFMAVGDGPWQRARPRLNVWRQTLPSVGTLTGRATFLDPETLRPLSEGADKRREGLLIGDWQHWCKSLCNSPTQFIAAKCPPPFGRSGIHQANHHNRQSFSCLDHHHLDEPDGYHIHCSEQSELELTKQRQERCLLYVLRIDLQLKLLRSSILVNKLSYWNNERNWKLRVHSKHW